MSTIPPNKKNPHTERDLTGPAMNQLQVTPSDTDLLPVLPRCVVALTSGTIVLEDANGEIVSYPVQPMTEIAVRAVKIRATGTDATVVIWW